jgi:transposase
VLIRIQFQPALVKELTAYWHRALARGDCRPVERITALLFVGQGRSVPEAAALLAIAESTLYQWLSALLLRGVASLHYRRSPGRPPKLSPAHKQRLLELLDAGPEACGYACGCWRGPLVQALIEREFGVLYNEHYISELLRNLGFSYQKARFVSDHLNEAARQEWLEQRWLEIVSTAFERNALLLFGDEVSFAQWGSLGYSWARRGQQPVVKTSGKRKGHKVWGLLDWFGGRLFYAGQQDNFTAKSYCAFLEGVLAQTEGWVIVVQDGARYHTAKQTKLWQAEHSARLLVYQLPSYSPDYNPIEHLWKAVKAAMHGRYFASYEQLAAAVEAELAKLQADRERLQGLMGTPLDHLVGEVLPVAA